MPKAIGYGKTKSGFRVKKKKKKKKKAKASKGGKW